MRWLLFSIVAFGWAVCLGLSGCGSTTTTNPLSAPATAIHDPAEGTAADAGIAAALRSYPSKTNRSPKRKRYARFQVSYWAPWERQSRSM